MALAVGAQENAVTGKPYIGNNVWVCAEHFCSLAMFGFVLMLVLLANVLMWSELLPKRWTHYPESNSQTSQPALPPV